MSAKFLTAVGFVFFALGGIGLVVPLMPTTIFWIVAAICFTKGSPGARERIYGHPRLGAIVRDYVEHGAVRRSAKVAAIGGIIVVYSISAALLVGKSSQVVAVVGLILVPVCVFIATRPEALAGSGANP